MKFKTIRFVNELAKKYPGIKQLERHPALEAGFTILAELEDA